MTTPPVFCKQIFQGLSLGLYAKVRPWKDRKFSSGIQNGFTLIEALLYIALFTIVVGGGIITIFGLLQSSESTRTRLSVETEGNFVIRKLDWALNGSTIVTPSLGGSGTTLSLSRDGTTYDFAFSGGVLTFSEDGGTAVPLTTANVVVTDPLFFHITGPPEGLEYTFFLNGKQFGPKARYMR